MIAMFYIKLKDEHSEWFYQRPGMWADFYSDAAYFETKEQAEIEANAVRASRQNHFGKVRVIETSRQGQ